MRISDWSSDVCSSDLPAPDGQRPPACRQASAPRGGLERPSARDPFAMKLFPGATRFQRWTMGATFLIVASYAISQNRQALVDVSKKIGRASCRERVCQYV